MSPGCVYRALGLGGGWAVVGVFWVSLAFCVFCVFWVFGCFGCFGCFVCFGCLGVRVGLLCVCFTKENEVLGVWTPSAPFAPI